MSSNAAPALGRWKVALSAFAVLAATPLAAQDDTAASGAAATASDPVPVPTPERPRVNVLVTVPRGEVNEAQVQECEERADAGAISGEIVVCRQVGDDGTNNFSDRDAARKRYAEETAFKGAPGTPDVAGDGIFKGPATISGQCLIPPCPPPAAVFIDVEALPKAPAGSDADRIARGLPPLGEDAELSEEEEKARREALGIKTTLPPRPKRKGN